LQTVSNSATVIINHQ